MTEFKLLSVTVRLSQEASEKFPYESIQYKDLDV